MRIAERSEWLRTWRGGLTRAVLPLDESDCPRHRRSSSFWNPRATRSRTAADHHRPCRRQRIRIACIPAAPAAVSAPESHPYSPRKRPPASAERHQPDAGGIGGNGWLLHPGSPASRGHAGRPDGVPGPGRRLRHADSTRSPCHPAIPSESARGLSGAASNLAGVRRPRWPTSVRQRLRP